MKTVAKIGSILLGISMVFVGMAVSDHVVRQRNATSTLAYKECVHLEEEINRPVPLLFGIYGPAQDIESIRKKEFDKYKSERLYEAERMGNTKQAKILKDSQYKSLDQECSEQSESRCGKLLNKDYSNIGILLSSEVAQCNALVVAENKKRCIDSCDNVLSEAKNYEPNDLACSIFHLQGETKCWRDDPMGLIHKCSEQWKTWGDLPFMEGCKQAEYKDHLKTAQLEHDICLDKCNP